MRRHLPIFAARPRAPRVGPIFSTFPIDSFLPSDLANLAAWFRLGQGITSAANAVSQWADQSGNGRHLKQATGAAQPTLQGDGSILFDGTSDCMKCDAFTQAQPTTIFMRAKHITWVSGAAFCDGNTTNTGLVRQRNAGASPQIEFSAGTVVGPDSNLALNTYGTICVVFNGASSLLQIDSTTATTGNAGSASMGGLTIGARGSADADFINAQYKEVILYNRSLSLAERARVTAYLGTL